MAHASSLAARIPELRGATAPRGLIRVGEGRDVPLTTRVAAVIDHPSFQRLRRVRQLGPTHLVYPGATHARFEHSIGVYGYARAFVQSLLETPAFAAAVSEADVLSVLAAGLLHDVGHYPFAHSLEALHHRGRDTPRHEDLAASVIRGEIQPLARGQRPIGDILRWDWGIDPERVIRLITAKRAALEHPTDKILQSIISGAIDADKMDYIERDSAHLGVPYGKNFDRDRLLASLTLNAAEDGLAIWAKGKISAEIFVFGRYAMFSEAYWHHTVRSASAMVEAALSDHVARTNPDPADLTEAVLTRGDDDLLDWLSDQAPPNSTTRKLLRGLTGDRRSLYKRVVTYCRAYAEPDKQAAYQRLYESDEAALQATAARIRERLERLTGHALHPSAVLLDIPPRDKDRLETFAVRFPEANGRTEYALHELSGMVAGVQRDLISVVKKIRIYCDPTVAAELQGRQAALEAACLEEVLRP
jgi:HD superfamily phosphohydrolase